MKNILDDMLNSLPKPAQIFLVLFVLFCGCNGFGVVRAQTDLPLPREVNWPPVVIEQTNDAHMRDHLVRDETGNFRLAVLAKYRIEFTRMPEDPSIVIINVIDTAIAALPSIPMAQPLGTTLDSLGFAEPLDPNKNFCAKCDLALRAEWDEADLGEQPASMRLWTNNPNLEVLFFLRPYFWPDGKNSAPMTIEIYERSL